MMKKAAKYRIRVRGELDERWSERLGGLRITVESMSGKQPITTLVGTLRDQAALAGVLNTVYELHLPVISVETIDRPES